ncbi:MAG: hypothetical protein ACLGI9_07835 [Thermoanaerobaculia bacterium]
MDTVRRIGNHSTSLELPDIVHLKLVGEVDLPECREINQTHLEFAKGLENMFYMIDLSELDDLPAAVRREASETVRILPLRGTVIYQTPLRAQVLARLLLSAVNLFKGGAGQNPVDFVDTREQARSWVERRRRQIAHVAA